MLKLTDKYEYLFIGFRQWQVHTISGDIFVKVKL